MKQSGRFSMAQKNRPRLIRPPPVVLTSNPKKIMLLIDRARRFSQPQIDRLPRDEIDR
ncbi:MAG: hypothetical protein GY708_23790 [Actinomycetia bacterium]|nr:hypothetical protein [Actinomycetes bacterium]MCP4087608.1 hypothetical protein [Actinomycetes bacterium]